MKTWNFRPGLKTLKAYQIEEKDWEIKADANESPFNLPPLVRERILGRLDYMPFHRYPDSEMRELRAQIAEQLGLTIQHVLIGNGSSELLLALCQAFGGPGRSIVFPAPAFSMYPIYAQLSDSQPVAVKLDENFYLEPAAVVQAARDANASLVLLCNPNNPTGSVMSQADIEAIVSQVECPVVVDEAYYEFYGETSLALLAKYPNLLITRTFSKAFGLAAARVGYLLADPAINQELKKVLMPYHVNALSLLSAEIVWQMQDEFVPLIKQVVQERKNLAISLAELPGVKVYPSETNFILIKLQQAAELAAALAEQEIAVRSLGNGPGLENCVRITVGSPMENETLLQEIREFLRSKA